MIDTLPANLPRARASNALDRLGLVAGGYGLVTWHRHANVDQPEMLAALVKVLGAVAARCPIVLPAHPRVAPHLNLDSPIDLS